MSDDTPAIAALAGHFPGLAPIPASLGTLAKVPDRRPAGAAAAENARRAIDSRQRRPELKAGDRHGKLVAVERLAPRVLCGVSRTMWRWACDCGRVVEQRADRVRSGEIRTCGCGMGRHTA